MKTFTEFTEKETSRLFKKYGVFFAFSNKQFEEGREKDVKYVRMDGGMLVPSDRVEAFIKEFDEQSEDQIKNYLQKYPMKKIIKYELANHEAGYTMDWTNTYYAVKGLGFTKKDVETVFNEWVIEQREFYITERKTHRCR